MKKPKRMKTVKAWAIVTAQGKMLDVDTCKRYVSEVYHRSDRIVRVEVREVGR